MPRTAFVQLATLFMPRDADEAGPGGAVTLALCGNDHGDAPCPLPHYTYCERDGDTVDVRVLFACEETQESDVRQRITAALVAGETLDPQGRVVRWTCQESRPGTIAPEEADHAAHLAAPSDPH